MSAFLSIVKKIWPASIRGQLILGITVVNLVIITAFVFDMVNRQRRFLEKQNLEQTFSFANNYAMNSSRFITAGDLDELGQMTLSYLNYPNLKYLMILSLEGVVLAHSDVKYIGKSPSDAISLQLKGSTTAKTLIENNHVLDVAVPVTVDRKIIGWARVGVGQEYISDNLAALVGNGLIYAITIILITTLLTIVFANKLSAGLYKLISTADRIKEGDKNVRAAPFKTVELQELGTAFNQMLDEISANENLLSMVIQNMPVGIWIFNENGEVILGNSAGREIWKGLPHVGISELGIYKAWYTDTKQSIAAEQWAGARAFKGETTINEEIEIETFGGNRKIILNSAIPLKGKGDAISGAIVINVDITDRKKITEQLALSESTFRTAFKHSAIGMALVSPEGKFLRVNRELCRMMGYSEQEFLSLTFQEITYPFNVDENRMNLEQILNGAINNFRMEKKYIHKNGSLVWAHLSSSLVRDSENKPLFFVSQIEDISESKKTNEQLKLSESTFRSAFDYSAIGITLVSPGGKFLRVNKALCKIVGYPETELLSLAFQDITHPDDLDEDLVHLKQTLDGEISSYRMEKRYVHKNGPIIWAHLTVSLVRDGQNNPLFFISQIEDISERKKAEALIKESEEKFRKLVEETLVGVFILQNEKFIYVNPQFERITGYQSTMLVNELTFGDLMHQDDPDQSWKEYLSGTAAKKQSGHFLVKALKKDGTALQLEVILSPITFEDKPAVIGTFIDITEQAEEEKRINKAVTDAQENERQQISMELHDNVNQLMAGCLLNIDFINLIVKDATAAPIINNLKEYTRKAIEELRRISHQLAPSVDTSISLEEKIKTVVNTMNVSNEIAVNYHFDKIEGTLNGDAQLTIYRIVQEQFTNIMKHAQASMVDITVHRQNGNIRMLIEDNGVGFDTQARKDGIGLENIKRRVQVINGNFSIKTFPGKGCKLFVQIPVN